jgi:hypothetical protein
VLAGPDHARCGAAAPWPTWKFGRKAYVASNADDVAVDIILPAKPPGKDAAGAKEKKPAEKKRRLTSFAAMPDDWPFDQPRDCAVITLRPIALGGRTDTACDAQ